MKLRLPLALSLLLLSSLAPAAKAVDYYWVGTGSDRISKPEAWQKEDGSAPGVGVSYTDMWVTNNPANTIIIDKDRVTDSTSKQLAFDFSPLCIGGLKVNVAGYSLTVAKASGVRILQLQEAGLGIGCNFAIDEDFSLLSVDDTSLGQLYVKLNADWNINLAAGKTLTVNAVLGDGANSTIHVSGASAAQLSRLILDKSVSTAAGTVGVFAAAWELVNTELILSAQNVTGSTNMSVDNVLMTFSTTQPDILANSLQIKSGGLTVDAGTADRTFSGSVAGDVNGMLTKKGSGNLYFLGNVTHQGGMSVEAGNVIFSGAGTGFVSGNITLATGSALVYDRAADFSYAGVVSGLGNLQKGGAGILTLTGNNTYTGGTTISGGSLKLDFSAAGVNNILSSAGTLTLSGGSLDMIGNNMSQTLGGLVLVDGTASVINISSGTLDMGAVTGSGSLIINTEGVSSLLTSSSTDAFSNVIYVNRTTGQTGSVSVVDGRLNVVAFSSLLAAGNNPGTIYMLNGGLTMTAADTVAGLFLFDIDGDPGGNTWTLAGDGMTVNGVLSYQGSGNYTVVGGTLKGNGLNLIKNGSGALIINSDTDFSGTVEVNDGTLALHGDNAIRAKVSVNSGSLNLEGVTDIAGNVGINGGILNINGGGSVITGDVSLNAGTLNINAQTDITGNVSLTTGTFNFSEGSITGDLRGSANLNVNGVGKTVTLTGSVNAYTGKIIIGADSTFNLRNAGTVSGLTLLDAGSAGTFAVSGTTNASFAFGASVNTNITYAAYDNAVNSLSLTAANALDLNLKFVGNGTIEMAGTNAFRLSSVDNALDGKFRVVGEKFVFIHNAEGTSLFKAGFRPDVEINLGATSQNGLVLGGAYNSEEDAFKIGNLSGTGGALRGDTNVVGSAAPRFISVLQTRNAEFAGIFLHNSTRTMNLIKEGAATLTLSGANTAEGVLKIKDGSIQLGNGGASGAWAGNIVFDKAADATADPSLVINRSNEYAYSKVISGAGNVVVRNGTFKLSAANTYAGSTTVLKGAVLSLDFAASGAAASNILSSAGSLVLSGGSLNLTGTATNRQTFTGMTLTDNTSSFISGTNAASGVSFTSGTISGNGLLEVSGIASFAGTISTEQLGNIIFNDGGAYFNASYQNGIISKGDPFAELLAQGNTATNYVLTKALTMTNAARETISGLMVSGTEYTLNLSAAGLEINNRLSYAGTTGQTVTITGGVLQVGTLDKKDAGTLVINSVLTVEGGVSTSGVLTLAGGATIGGNLTGAGTLNVSGNGNIVTINGTVAGYTGAYALDAGAALKLTQTETLGTVNISGSGTLSLGGGSTATVNVADANKNMKYEVGAGSLLNLNGGAGGADLGLSGAGTVVSMGGGNLTVTSVNNRFSGTLRLTGEKYLFLTSSGRGTFFADGFRPDLEINLGAASANGLVLGGAYNNADTAFKIGNLSGTGGHIRGDVQDGDNATRYMSVMQTRDGEFGGIFFLSSSNRSVSLIKEGSAVLTLSGNNTSDKDLTIKDGSIQFGNGGTTGSWAGNIVFAPSEGKTASLIINRDKDADKETYEFSKSLSGNGELVIAGPAATVLSGTNTHTGGTTVNAGRTLLASASTALGAAGGNINLNAGSVLASNGAGTLSLTQKVNALSGVSSLGAAQTYTGRVVLGGGADIAGGATLQLVSADIASVITGTGTLSLSGGSVSSITAGGLKGSTKLTLGDGSQLTFGDGLSAQTAGLLTFGNSSVIHFSSTPLTVSFSDYQKDAGSLNITGYVLDRNNYIMVGNVQAWQKVDGITIDGKEAMFDNRGRLIEYSEGSMVGSLVTTSINPAPGSNGYYTYQTDRSFFGAVAGVDIDFSRSFLFAAGAATYGFTTVDDDSGILAGGFKVSSRLEGDRSVHLIGQGTAGREVVFTNTGNSYTGGTLIDNATLRLQAADGAVFDRNNVTLMGAGGPVRLTNQGMIQLSTGTDAYTYSNSFQFNDGGGTIAQMAGTHTLSGSITLNGSDAGVRQISNNTANDMILTGKLLANGNNTLTLTTQAVKESRILLNMADSSSRLNRLVVNGNVEMNAPRFTIDNGLVMNGIGTFAVNSGILSVGGEITSQIASDLIFRGNSTLTVSDKDLTVSSNVTLKMEGNQSRFTLDSGSHTLTLNGSMNIAPGNTVAKTGSGTLRLNAGSTVSDFLLNQGTLSLGENTSLNSTGTVTVAQGSILNFSKGSSLNTSGLIMKGSMTGNDGSLNGVSEVKFQSGSRYAASMSRQSWAASFEGGSVMSGSLQNHTGNIVFREGSSIVFNTDLPVEKHVPQISAAGNVSVSFQGVSVTGTTATPEIDWDSTQVYTFTLVTSNQELLGRDGQALTEDNLSNSVHLGQDGWGAFLQAELGLDNVGKDLVVKINRNALSLGMFAQTGNQMVVANALDYAMDNYSQLDIRGTELGDVIQYFNKMGQNIASEAPEALGMVGGLSNYQALAGQRTDMMRHLEAVRQRANAGKGLAGISNIPDNSFWAEGTQSYSRVDGVDNSTPGYTAQTWGAAIGVDYLSGPNYSLGVAFAYSNLTVDSNQYAGQTKSDNYYVDLYGRWESGNWNGVFVLSGGTADVDVKRSMNLGGDTYQGKGSTDGTQILGMAEVAYDWQWEEEGPVLQPYLGMAVGGSKLDGYTESGLGNAGLVMDEQKQTVAQASLGVRLYKQNIDREMQYETSRWELRCGLVEEFGDTDFVTRSSFIGLPGYTMSTTSDDIGRTGLQIGGGFSCAIDQAWSVFGDVNGEFRNGQTSMNSTLGLRCTF